MNATVATPYVVLDHLVKGIPISTSTPWYYSHEKRVIPWIADKYLAMITPVAVYWIYSLWFHLLDTQSQRAPFRWLQPERYRIHESEEETKRNKTTPQEVVRAVISQQILQTALAYWWLPAEEAEVTMVDHFAGMERLAPWMLAGLQVLLGDVTARRVFESTGTTLLYVVYWWAIPIFQCMLAFFVIDTWQYFLHRGMHMNKYLYRKLHSVHHRLYVPYAYGALYNHPIEGFLLDTLGAAIAEAVARLTIRETIFLFGFSIAKTVDDHCGFALPWDPLQRLYPNNARYHNIHHQHFGLKYNFSQPFWVHWDVLLGTRWEKPAPPLPSEKKPVTTTGEKPVEDFANDSDVSEDSGVALKED